MQGITVFITFIYIITKTNGYFSSLNTILDVALVFRITLHNNYRFRMKGKPFKKHQVDNM